MDGQLVRADFLFLLPFSTTALPCRFSCVEPFLAVPRESGPNELEDEAKDDCTGTQRETDRQAGRQAVPLSINGSARSEAPCCYFSSFLLLALSSVPMPGWRCLSELFCCKIALDNDACGIKPVPVRGRSFLLSSLAVCTMCASL